MTGKEKHVYMFHHLPDPNPYTHLPVPQFPFFSARYRERAQRDLTRKLRLVESTADEEKRVGIAVAPEFAEWAWGFPAGWTDPKLFGTA